MSKTINATLFYANWCGHCKVFKEEWLKFKNMIKDTTNITSDDYEDSNLPKEGAKIQNKDIRGYPTIKITKTLNGNSTEYEYDGKRKAEDLYQHILKQLDQKNK
jgi:hypothetical protein